MPSAFVVSLDFELHWGVRDHSSVEQYRRQLLGARAAVPRMLAMFRERDVAATWATVGFLMAESKKELLDFAPTKRPRYCDSRLSPYHCLDEIGANEENDPFHFAPSLVQLIQSTPHQEVATHTFSHYYALEHGQSVAEFDADVAAACHLARHRGIAIRSIVFPRNQFNGDVLPVLRRHGIVAYRSNGTHWAYEARPAETTARRVFRLADSYVALSGSRTAEWPRSEEGLVDVRASAFLRPVRKNADALERLRLKRLVGQMTQAARNGGIFHLWWHPHNFGLHVDESLSFLSRLLDHFDVLREDHGMESLSMRDVAARVARTSYASAS